MFALTLSLAYFLTINQMAKWLVKEWEGLETRFQLEGAKKSSTLNRNDGQIRVLESEVANLKR